MRQKSQLSSNIGIDVCDLNIDDKEKKASAMRKQVFRFKLIKTALRLPNAHVQLIFLE